MVKGVCGSLSFYFLFLLLLLLLCFYFVFFYEGDLPLHQQEYEDVSLLILHKFSV